MAKEKFKEYDSDNDGFLNINEFHNSIIVLGLKIAIEDNKILYNSLLNNKKLDYIQVIKDAKEYIKNLKVENESQVFLFFKFCLQVYKRISGNKRSASSTTLKGSNISLRENKRSNSANITKSTIDTSFNGELRKADTNDHPIIRHLQRQAVFKISNKYDLDSFKDEIYKYGVNIDKYDSETNNIHLIYPHLDVVADGNTFSCYLLLVYKLGKGHRIIPDKYGKLPDKRSGINIFIIDNDVMCFDKKWYRDLKELLKKYGDPDSINIYLQHIYVYYIQLK